jgi:outer membrane receptor protein involved in Fe transport
VTDLRLAWRWRPGSELAFGIDNLANRRQPINWSSVGGTMEPAGRFFHLALRQRF